MVALVALVLSAALTDQDPEVKIVEYLKAQVQPGQPVIVSELLNQVFTAPEERKAIDRLFGAFFKIPLYAAEQQQRTGRPPTLREISEQFRLPVPGEAEVLVRIVTADPRIPRFIERDAVTGEITRVDVAAIRAHPRFGKALERTLAGWEGRPLPAFALHGFEGGEIRSESLVGRPLLIYFWFSGCPPCLETSPELAALHRRHAAAGLTVLGVNADRLLEVPATDQDRRAYARQSGMAFDQAHLTAEAQDAFGGVTVFPTIIAVARNGTVLRQIVNAPQAAVLEQLAQELLK